MRVDPRRETILKLRPFCYPLALGALTSLVPASAWAQGFSTDIELVRPTFSPRSTLGVDSPFIGGEGHLTLGLQSAYARDPLRLIEFDRLSGPVVRNRFGNHLGLAWAPSDRLSLRASLPLVWQWGSSIDEYRADGPGVGDLRAGLRYLIWEGGGFTIGAHGDFVLNVGTRNAYLGETQPRTSFGLLTAYESGPLLILGTLGAETRSNLDTQLDFNLGNELVANTALVYTMPGDEIAFSAELLSRFGMSRLFVGGAESSMEWILGTQVPLSDSFGMHLGVGRGITAGYGTSSFRGLFSIRYQRTPPPPVEEPDYIVDIIDIPDDLIDEPDPEPTTVVITPTQEPGEWREGQLARVAVDRIEIREPIQFEFATPRILPVSLPLLRQVAGLLNRDARIGHLLIEGHASQEGSHSYNYDLSIRRAKAVYEQLLVLGVHPSRMSYRGMGKVVPLSDRTDEESLAENRRVEFQILYQRAPGDELPELSPEVKLPWSGESATVQTPTEIPAVKVRPAPPPDLLDDSATEPVSPEPEPLEPTPPGSQPTAEPSEGSTGAPPSSTPEPEPESDTVEPSFEPESAPEPEPESTPEPEPEDDAPLPPPPEIQPSSPEFP
ncbi:MAG: OmpA family protein [Deltaproteobacteria bacterium]|nr:MAG: OmpA family protein [Deltaproteobacteria bacterium]